MLPKFGSVRFSPLFWEPRTELIKHFLELNRTRTEPFRTGSNCRTARNFEKCKLHIFYTLKPIVTCNLCLNFFVLILFDGPSARKREIDKKLPYLVMTNHSKPRKSGQYNSITAFFRQTGPIITFLHLIQGILHSFLCISSENFDWFSNGSGNLENSQNRELNRGQKLENRNRTEPNFRFGSVGSGSLHQFRMLSCGTDCGNFRNAGRSYTGHVRLGLRTVRIMGTAISVTGQTGCPHRQPYRFYLTSIAKRFGSCLKRVPTAVDGRFKLSYVI